MKLKKLVKRGIYCLLLLLLLLCCYCFALLLLCCFASSCDVIVNTKNTPD